MEYILITCKEFWPDSSAITNMLSPYLDEIKQKYKIIILTRRTYKMKHSETHDNINIYRVYDILQLLNKNNFIFKFLYRVYYYLFCREEYDKFHVFVEKIVMRKLIKKYSINKVISCSYPFDNHIIAASLKNKMNFKWFAIQFDPFTFNHTLSSLFIPRRMEFESKVLSLCDKVFIPEENYIENVNNGLELLQKKYRLFYYGTITDSGEHDCATKDWSFVYTGRFYRNLREPDAMIDYFSHTTLPYSLQIHYICEDEEIDRKLLLFENNNQGKVKLYKNSSKKTCDQAIAESNFIINIGNNEKNQTPSKVFEIITSRKPCLNFYSINLDTSRKVLDRYPLCLSVFTGNDLNYSYIDSELYKMKDLTISFADLCILYPEYINSTKYFMEEIEGE